LDFQVSVISNRILLGPFLSPARAAYLQTLGITHVLNVSEAPSVVSAGDYGFAVIADYPLTDITLIPDDVAIACVDALHRMLTPPATKVYVHCIAGQNRSATVIWLYLIASGLSREAAKALVERAALDAIPGHTSLIDDRLASLVEDHGCRTFAPLADATALEPA
jgi:hypothetical protein